MGSTIEITEARKQLNGLSERLRDERVIVVTKHSRQAFAMVDIGYLSSLLEMVEMFSEPEKMRTLRRMIDAAR